MRFWAYMQQKYSDIHPDIQLFVNYFDAGQAEQLPHSFGLQKGQMAVINAFAGKRFASKNAVVITHELLHTVGATDKYNLETNQPLYPIGYAEPNRSLLYPQKMAEIMGGRVPTSANTSFIPKNLEQTLIGQETALEIKWIQ